MPRAKRRKQARKRVSQGVAREQQVEQARPVRSGIPARGASTQNLIYSLMVAFGFWGLAIFCTFFYGEDPNHYLYGAIMGLTAVGWSIVVGRRWLAYRQRA